MVQLKSIILSIVCISLLYTQGMGQYIDVHVNQTTELRYPFRIKNVTRWWHDPRLPLTESLVISSSGSAHALLEASRQLVKASPIIKKLIPPTRIVPFFIVVPFVTKVVLGIEPIDFVGMQALRINAENHNAHVFSVNTRPVFDLVSGVEHGFTVNQNFFYPSTNTLAARIFMAWSEMKSPNKKLILIGKSMGGCQMYRAANRLKDFGVDVDALILVDASCSIADHSKSIYDRKIESNVKKVYNFYQRKVGERQNGYKVRTEKATTGLLRFNYDVNERNICPNVGHGEIDTCARLLDIISSISTTVLR